MFRKGERKQFSGGVGTGGLVSVEALDRENDTTASAVKSSRKVVEQLSYIILRPWRINTNPTPVLYFIPAFILDFHQHLAV